MKRIAGAICCAVLVGLSPAAMAASCMSDTAKHVKAEGRLHLGHFKDAADRPETAWILTLPAAACLSSNDPDMRVRSTRRIHLAPNNTQTAKLLQRYNGRTVLVRGAPFAAHTAHHHAPIVMLIDEIGMQ